MDPFVHPTAVVDPDAELRPGVWIWHFTHVDRGAVLGAGTSLGQNVYVAAGVRLGARVRVQNNVSVYAGVEVEDDVFLGPSCVLTNVKNPRAGVDRRAASTPTRLRRGCTIGANATVVCGVTVGQHAFVGAGAVVTHDVPDYALVVGTPARQVGWMGRHGARLVADGEGFRCPESGLRYVVAGEGLRCADLAEDAALP